MEDAHRLSWGLMIINVYAPDSAKNFQGIEKFMRVLERVMLGGWRARGRKAFVRGTVMHGGQRRIEGDVSAAMLVRY